MSAVLQKRETMRDLIKKEKASYEEYRKPLEIQEAAEKAERKKRKEEQKEHQEATQAAVRADQMTKEDQARKDSEAMERERTKAEAVKTNGKGKDRAVDSPKPKANTRKGKNKIIEVVTVDDSDDEASSPVKGSSPLQFEDSIVKALDPVTALKGYLEPRDSAGPEGRRMQPQTSNVGEVIADSGLPPSGYWDAPRVIEEFDDPPSNLMISIRSKTPTIPPPPIRNGNYLEAPPAPPPSILHMPTLPAVQPRPQLYPEPRLQTELPSDPYSSHYFGERPNLEESHSPPRPSKRPKHGQPNGSSESQHTRFTKDIEDANGARRSEVGRLDTIFDDQIDPTAGNATSGNQDSEDDMVIVESEFVAPGYNGQAFDMPTRLSVKGAAGSSSSNSRSTGGGNSRKSFGEA